MNITLLLSPTGSSLPKDRLRPQATFLDRPVGNHRQRGRGHLEQCRPQDPVRHVPRPDVPAANHDPAHPFGRHRLD